MDFRFKLQLAEARGALNRWYCSQCHCRQIDDDEMLMRYYIKSGGAKDFARRYEEAMGMLNKWYCSEFYGRAIGDPEILWDYYMSHAAGKGLPTAQEEREAELSMA